MEYSIKQKVTVVDHNGELIEEVYFDHGSFSFQSIQTGYHIETKKLGLKNFEVLYDNRSEDTLRSQVIDIEISLVHPEKTAHVYLEPLELILGLHDIGLV